MSDGGMPYGVCRVPIFGIRRNKQFQFSNDTHRMRQFRTCSSIEPNCETKRGEKNPYSYDPLQLHHYINIIHAETFIVTISCVPPTINRGN
jgi:hypothetical protein